MPRILDIDLDFFVKEIVYGETNGPRPDPNIYPPWPIKKAKSYLRNNLGLSENEPIKGFAVENHSEVFFIWRELILSEKLKTPFDLVHIDSHADLGCQDLGYIYLCSEIMFNEQKERWFPEFGLRKLGDGNFLAFALACGWISKYIYLYPLNWINDICYLFMQGNDLDSNYLQMKAINNSQIETMNYLIGQKVDIHIKTDPPIPFVRIPAIKYRNNREFDYVFLSRSPAFSPQPLDELYDFIKTQLIKIQ